MKRLDEIEAREREADEGPWNFGRFVGWFDGSRIAASDDLWRSPADEACGWEMMVSGGAEADFIAHAREDVPWLCARLREAVELLAQTARGDWDRNSAYDEWIARRDALLAALDEKGPGR